MMRWSTFAILALFATTGANAANAAAAADCAALSSVKRNETYKQNPEDVLQCMQRGWDPPVEWRANGGKNTGIKVGGTGGFIYNTVRAPEQSPGQLNSPWSINNWLMNFSMNIPPWGNLGDGDTNGDGKPDIDPSASCKVVNDQGDTFGQKQPVSGNMSATLTCGGALPLAGYQMTLNPGANYLFATESGSYSYWVYKRNGNSYSQVASGTLPTYLCEKKNGKMKKTVDLKPAVAQMITYADGAPSMAVRLQPQYPGDVFDPFEMDPNDPDEVQERYLVVPLKNGMPQVPTNCKDESDYYKPIGGIPGAVVVQGSTAAICTGSNCSSNNGGATSTGPASCDVATLNPTAASQSQQDNVCQGSTLFVPLDRPNLVYPPGSTPVTLAIQGRTAVMAQTMQGSSIYAQSDTLFYFGAGGSQFTLPEGGTMLLDNGGQLQMNAPATLFPSSKAVTLTNGGTVTNQFGQTVQTIPPGGSISPPAPFPFAVRVGRNVDMPAGYYVPTAANPYIRLPVIPPPATP